MLRQFGADCSRSIQFFSSWEGFGRWLTEPGMQDEVTPPMLPPKNRHKDESLYQSRASSVSSSGGGGRPQQPLPQPPSHQSSSSSLPSYMGTITGGGAPPGSGSGKTNFSAIQLQLQNQLHFKQYHQLTQQPWQREHLPQQPQSLGYEPSSRHESSKQSSRNRSYSGSSERGDRGDPQQHHQKSSNIEKQQQKQQSYQTLPKNHHHHHNSSSATTSFSTQTPPMQQSQQAASHHHHHPQQQQQQQSQQAVTQPQQQQQPKSILSKSRSNEAREREREHREREREHRERERERSSHRSSGAATSHEYHHDPRPGTEGGPGGGGGAKNVNPNVYYRSLQRGGLQANNDLYSVTEL
uniref:(northern house mosquito) hypothetical protein n=1 Tax=Culex pipiens TaxID=7175 RepID=A0A8D8HRX4_CULPI